VRDVRLLFLFVSLGRRLGGIPITRPAPSARRTRYVHAVCRRPGVSEQHGGRYVCWRVDTPWSERTPHVARPLAADKHIAAILQRLDSKGKGKGGVSSKQRFTELRSVTCNMESHSLSWHPTPCRALTPTRQAGTRFTYHKGMKGWVDPVVRNTIRYVSIQCNFALAIWQIGCQFNLAQKLKRTKFVNFFPFKHSAAGLNVQ